MADRLFGVILRRLPDLQAWENVGGGDRDEIQQKPPFDRKDDRGTTGRHRWDYETGWGRWECQTGLAVMICHYTVFFDPSRSDNPHLF